MLNFCIAAVLLSLALDPTSPVDILKFTTPLPPSLYRLDPGEYLEDDSAKLLYGLLSLAIGPTSLVNILKYFIPPFSLPSGLIRAELLYGSRPPQLGDWPDLSCRHTEVLPPFFLPS